MSKNRNREFVSTSGTANDVIQKLARAVYTLGGNDDNLRRIISDETLCRRVAEMVLGVAQTAPGAETVTVPDLPAEALVAVVKEAVGLTYLNPDYAKYAFLQGERGKTYEVLTWKPGRGVSSDAVREHFNALGFHGNTAAFLEWNRKDHGDGWFVSIPDEDDRCFRDAVRDLYAPYFYRDAAYRKLYLLGLAGDWYDGFVFVAFCECLK